MRRGMGWAAALLAAAALGCGDETPTSGTGAKPSALAKRGKAVYNATCTACHPADPAAEGGLGPPIVGSSRELLEARVLRGEYPPGYEPKSDTRLMIPLPHLEGDIDALAAYLADPH